MKILLMCDGRMRTGGRWLRRLAFVFSITPFLFIPEFAAADFMAPPPPTPFTDTYATHAGITIANAFPRTESFAAPIISGEALTAIDTSWTIETKPWNYNGGDDIPSERAVWVMFRGKQDGLDGTPQAGENYVLTHHGLAGNATTTMSAVFGLPALGDPGTPSGTYTFVVAQIPESKFVVTNILSVDENGIQLVEGYDAPYTDQDFINWFAGIDTNSGQPGEMRTLEFEYTAGAAHVPCTQDCFSNVLFLPGIEASRLYRPDYNGGTDKLWEPNINSDVQDLFLNQDGTSVRYDIYTKERDVLDELPDGENMYKSFIARMDALENDGKINDWEPIAYDWRLSLDDILNYGNDIDGRIYYSGDLRATSTPYVIQELRRLAATSKSGKVTIIAHSNGGLVAKRLTEILGAEASGLIDKMIFVAVPQVGTPMAIAAGMHGYDQGHLFGFITSEATARTFAQNAPTEYQLLPSAEYFTQVDEPVVTFDSSLADWIAKYGDVIHSRERLHDFLTGTFGKVDSETGNINEPIQLNDSLLSSAEALHNDLDLWVPPTGVQLIQIAGWGIDSTLKSITYSKKGNAITFAASTTIDGDGTVVVPSALWVSTKTGAVNYWVNLGDYNSNHRAQTFLGLFPFNHGNILEVEPVLKFISDSIKKDVSDNIDDYSDFSTSQPLFTGHRLHFALHSPLTLNLYDDWGRHTGMSTTTGQLEEQIPGTYYTEIGDVKYLFADASASFRVILQGTDTGTFTFVINETQGDTVLDSTTFGDIPVTPQTVVSMSLTSGLASASDLAVDEDGNGTIDSQYASSTGQLIVQAVPAPAPAASAGGGGNGPPLQAVSATTINGSPTITIVATSSETAVVEATTTVTTSSPLSSTSSKSHVVIKKSPTRHVTAVSAKRIAESRPAAQVASAAQSTDGGLWSRLIQWIIEKLHI